MGINNSEENLELGKTDEIPERGVNALGYSIQDPSEDPVDQRRSPFKKGPFKRGPFKGQGLT